MGEVTQQHVHEYTEVIQRLTRLETNDEHMEETLKSMDATLQGINGRLTDGSVKFEGHATRLDDAERRLDSSDKWRWTLVTGILVSVAGAVASNVIN